MVDKCTICLVGPKSAGKSSLLQTFIDCMALGGHGYSERMNISVEDINETEYAGGEVVKQILGGNSGIYQSYRNAFFTEQVQTDSTIEFFFRLTSDAVAGKPEAGGTPSNQMLLRIVDSAGEYAVKEDIYGSFDPQQQIQAPSESVQKLNDALMQAEAAIVVVPLVDMGRATFAGPLKNLLAKLVNTNSDKPRRIVVAFTQYEKLFVRAGRDAFRAAIMPGVARSVIRRAIGQAVWADDLRSFAKMPRRKVYFTVTSSYGFAKGLGIPNVDPHWRPSDGKVLSEQLFGKPDDIATFWRPFLTADPFICAAIDQPGELTFTFEKLFPEDQARSPNGKEGREGPGSGPNGGQGGPPASSWWRDGLNWFNRKGN